MESLLPFLQGTCTPYNMPVYPGAQCIIADSLSELCRTLMSELDSGFVGELRATRTLPVVGRSGA
jgi:hypothetical protein